MTDFEGNHDTRHGACGRTWKQRGNRTGHCARCHETFEGLGLFDYHMAVGVCSQPSELEYPTGYALQLINGSWRTTKTHPKASTK